MLSGAQWVCLQMCLCGVCEPLYPWEGVQSVCAYRRMSTCNVYMRGIVCLCVCLCGVCGQRESEWLCVCGGRVWGV